MVNRCLARTSFVPNIYYFHSSPTISFSQSSLFRVFVTLCVSLSLYHSMAEEAQYSSGADYATTKRKYDDSTTPPPPSSTRRATGFSAPIIPSQSPDSAPAYNSVPPPVDEIELAKQRAQEIAARIFSSAEAKRPKFDNGGGGGGYDSNDSKGFSSGPPGSILCSNLIFHVPFRCRVCDCDYCFCNIVLISKTSMSFE